MTMQQRGSKAYPRSVKFAVALSYRANRRHIMSQSLQYYDKNNQTRPTEIRVDNVAIAYLEKVFAEIYLPKHRRTSPNTIKIFVTGISDTCVFCSSMLQYTGISC